MSAPPAQRVTARPAASRRLWWVVGAVGCGLGVAFAVWWGFATNSTGISYQTISYAHVDPRTLDVTFEVTKPTRTAVTCLVQALDARFGSVGSTQVSLPARAGASASTTVRQVTRVRTTTTAVAGLVKICAPT